MQDREYHKFISFRHVTGKDIDILHTWMQLPHIAPFWKLNVSRDRFAGYLDRTLHADNKRVFLVYVDDLPVAYLMAYSIFQDPVKDYYEAKSGDLGMHLLIGPREFLNKDDGLMLIRAMTAFLMEKYECGRIIGEPDVRNRIVIPILKRIGGERFGTITMPHKKAALMIGERNNFYRYLLTKDVKFRKEPKLEDNTFWKAGAPCEKELSN